MRLGNPSTIFQQANHGAPDRFFRTERPFIRVWHPDLNPLDVQAVDLERLSIALNRNESVFAQPSEFVPFAFSGDSLDSDLNCCSVRDEKLKVVVTGDQSSRTYVPGNSLSGRIQVELAKVRYYAVTPSNRPG